MEITSGMVKKTKMSAEVVLREIKATWHLFVKNEKKIGQQNTKLGKRNK